MVFFYFIFELCEKMDLVPIILLWEHSQLIDHMNSIDHRCASCPPSEYIETQLLPLYVQEVNLT
jgi:hypothetical protein